MDRDRDSARHSGDMPVLVLAAVLGRASGDRQRCAASAGGLLEYGSYWRGVPRTRRCVLRGGWTSCACTQRRSVCDKDGRAPQGYLLLGTQYSAVLRQTLPRRYRNPSGRRKTKIGLKGKGEEAQLANERRAIRANGWGGVWERPNCQAPLIGAAAANGALQCR